jgi:prepilin-type N-terminal cleavage/methylation domain-containing protein
LQAHIAGHVRREGGEDEIVRLAGADNVKGVAMASRVASRDRERSAFTLIELLVVVAIIALLISILLPSLSKAREQARTTLCMSRISQLTKSMLLYEGDYGTPPFVGVGFENINKDKAYPHLNSSEMQLAKLENWLYGDPTLNSAWLADPWSALPMGGPTARDGMLFSYTRFESLYRCPEFERIMDARKTQNVFNYTRTVLGRKVLSSVVPDPEAGDDELFPGATLPSSAIYAPAAMMMLLDEQWDFHCAGNYNDGGIVNMSGCWMGAEPIHGIVFDMIGSYHSNLGSVLPAERWPELKKAKMGSVSFYDGHVALMRDPWPWRTIEKGSADLMQLITKLTSDPEGTKLIDPLLMSVYAQRGINFTWDMALALIN